MQTHDLLIEIGTEELPPKQLQTLIQAFATNIQSELNNKALAHGQIKCFATPRRLALLIENVVAEQESRTVEKRGPTLKAAYDAQGNATIACLGFANACGVTLDELEVRKTDQGSWLFFTSSYVGQSTSALLPEILVSALSRLPIPKPMRWGSHAAAFIRPIHWVVLMLDDKLVRANIFEQKTVKHTYGHRFHHPEAINIPHAQSYETLLKKEGYVIPDYHERRQIIDQQVQEIAKKHKGKATVDASLLDEVTNLVEWPVALLGKFDPSFLELPPEVIATSLKTHQKSFSVADDRGQTLPYFITISNIESKDPQRVISGNERVIRARLSDAKFFYEADLKHTLTQDLERTKNVIFQKQLGSLFEKAKRISMLSHYLAEQLNISSAQGKEIAEAGLLSKADLMTNMVAEFPELQGTIGYYYAKNDGLSDDIATAIKTHYQPRFAGDALPHTTAGALVSVADKIDTLTGLFGVNQPPTGEKDPFGLRRAAIGVLRTLVEKKLPVDLFALLHASVEQYGNILDNPQTEQQTFAFMMERLRAWYADKGVASEIISAVLAKSPTQPLDLHERIQAVQHFQRLPEAKALAAANKRVSRILKDQKQIGEKPLNINLSESPAEHQLITLVKEKTKEIEPLYQTGKYTEMLTSLATLQTPVDHFFDQVMVMTDDRVLRQHRLSILYQLQQLFLRVADISLLAS
ncbi:MAG: glyS [Gammaproteobacteria bacterium]|jgi:glycyl-tRNA synthetase beta chain|nr:glyS [Gammaproteobacteria bacterium]